MSVALVASLLWTPAAATAIDPLPVAPGHAKTEVATTGSSAEVATQTTTQFATGDVFVAVGNGQIHWRHPDGSLNATLDTGLGGFTTGMAFDKPGTRLYATAFSANTIAAFDASGAKVGTLGSGYNCSPESIAFNAAGDLYVGQADCTGDVVHLGGSGSLLGTHNVPVDRRGSDWVELAADQCTLYYTSEGTKVEPYWVPWRP